MRPSRTLPSTPHGGIALVLAAATGLGILARTSDAHAVERQHHIGLSPTLALLKVGDKSTMSTGAGLTLHYTYGLSDQFNLMGELSTAIVALKQQQDQPEAPHTRPAEVDHATAGVGYVIDYLQWVPYFCGLVGGYRLAGGTLDSALVLPGAEVGLGLDYQLSRRFAIGAAARQHFLITKISDYPTYTTVMLRFETMWGW